MVDNKKSRSNEEEIDLGQLFSLIGRGVSSFFGFFIKLAETVGRWMITFIIFTRFHIVKLSIAAVIGAVLGGIYQYEYKTPIYYSSMTVQPNFGSTVQLYKNIDLFQSLVRQNDIERLANNLSITVDEASNISGFKVEPYTNSNESILAYERFITDLDSSIVKKIVFEDFIENQPLESFRYHVITVNSKDKYVFSKLGSGIISSVIRNQYYDKVRATSFSNLISKREAIESSMSELDTLRYLYKEVMLAESKKINSGTNVFMSSAGSDDKEVVVFDKYMIMNDELINVNKQLTDEKEVVNVVSSFNPVGIKISGWRTNYILLGFIGGFLIVMFAVSLVSFNRALNKIEEKRQQ